MRIKDETLAYIWIGAILSITIGGSFAFGFAPPFWSKVSLIGTVVSVFIISMMPICFPGLFDRDPPPVVGGQ